MAEKLKMKKHPFAGWPMIIVWLAMLIFSGHSITHMVGAGDTWVAMACGRHFLDQGFKNVTVEPFSFNSHKAGPTDEGMKEYAKTLRDAAEKQRQLAKPEVFQNQRPQPNDPISKGSNLKAAVFEKWADICQSYENWPGWTKSAATWIHPTGWVNQNWLTHVIFYWLTHELTGSVEQPYYDALVYWKFAIYLLTAALVYYATRIMGATPVLAAMAGCLSVFIGRSFYDIRPAGFSNMLVAALLLIYVLTTYRNHLYIWLIVPVMVFWCNVHGGFIYAFMTFVPFIGTHFLFLLTKKWRTILYWSGATLLFLYTLMKIGNTQYYSGGDEASYAFLELIALAMALVAGGVVFTKCNYYIKTVSVKGLVHIIAAAAASFIAAVLFNPYHLTNFTHTLIVSVSEQAKMWRQVHEWHPAFAWANPVGTSIPFMIALILMIGLAIIWLVSYIYRARIENVRLISPKSTENFAGFLKYSLAVVITVAAFPAFQLCNPSLQYLIAVAIFVILVLLSIDVSRWIMPFVGFFSIIVLLMAQEEKAYAGMYIFPFLIIPAYVIFNLIFAKDRSLKPIVFAITAATAIGSFAAMMIVGTKNPIGLEFNGFGGTLENFISLRASFVPDFRPSGSGNSDSLAIYDNFFGCLMAINLLSAFAWLVVYLFKKPASENKTQQTTNNLESNEVYNLPKIDLTVIIIAIITIFLALKMRRFITFAGVMIAPLIALFIDQIARIATSIFNKQKFGQFILTPMSPMIRKTIIGIGMLTVAFYGSYWGMKYHRIYLAPCTSEIEDEFSTVFMRMSASNAKPFAACKFIRDNNISGHMYNYWTEGGFIAYGQTPDPNTGKIPLQLYMDGRAQAAYSPEAYIDWITVMGGGPALYASNQERRNPTQKEFAEAGKWINNIFKQKDVWVILMPLNQVNSEFMRAIETQANWRVAYLDTKQRMLVDTDTQAGMKIFSGIFSGETKFPNEPSKNITLAYNMLRTNNPEYVAQGFEAAKSAIKEYPSGGTVINLNITSQIPALREKTLDLCKEIDTDFTENIEKYKNRNGFRERAITEMTALEILTRYDKNYNRQETNNRIEQLTSDPLLNPENAKW